MMKRITGSLLVVFIAVGMMITAMAQTESSVDTYIVDFPVYNNSFSVYPDAREKSNSSAMYIYISSLSSSTYVRVQARGMEYPDWTYYYANLSNTSNETCRADGTMANYVVCYGLVDYSVHSYINEHGFEGATYGFETPYGTSPIYLDAVWSPDSTYSHVDAN